MGCLCSKSDDDKDGRQEINLSAIGSITTTNASVMCHCGQKADTIQVYHNNDNSYDISGQGILLGSCPLECDTGRWEVKIGKEPSSLQLGLLRINNNSKKGLTPTDLSTHTLQDYQDHTTTPAWFLHAKDLQEGDVVGIYWDQTDFPMVRFSINGQEVSSLAIHRIRPSSEVYPAVSVIGQGRLTLTFDEASFQYPPIHKKFKMIIASTSLI
eukprot:gene10920-12136_t